MKRFLTFLAAACVVALSSCQREPAPELQFSQALYTAYTGGGEVEVVLQISKSQEADLSIPAIFSGSAVKGTDYTVSADAFSIRRGQTSGTITIKNISLTEEKQVSITFNAPAGCTAGVRNTAVVAPDDKEMLICSFTATQAVVLESYIATVDVTGATTGSDFKASERIELPLKVTGSGASEIAAGKIIIEAGQSKGRAEINLANKSFSGEAVAALSFESGGRVLPGDNDELLLLIRGLQTPDKLIGTWKFAEVYDLEEMELWFMEMEDDPDELPTHNDGFVLTFAKEGSDVYVTPSGSGDFNKFFRKAKVSLATPVNMTSSGIKLGQYSTDEANMFVSEVAEKYQQNTYYELDKANLDFSADSETIGKAKIVFRITPDGDLAMEFRQYDNADCFGMMWWDDGSKFDPEMFGFASRFTRQ